MAIETRSPAVLRFGTFELDLRSGELRKQGLRVKLQEQPFRVLSVLLRHPGQVVNREERGEKLVRLPFDRLGGGFERTFCR